MVSVWMLGGWVGRGCVWRGRAGGWNGLRSGVSSWREHGWEELQFVEL